MSNGSIHNKEDILSLITSHRAVIKDYGVNALGLFGSFVKESFTEDSDIDLLVTFDPGKKSFDNFMDLAFFLEELLKRKVELVTLESLRGQIRSQILSEVEYIQL